MKRNRNILLTACAALLLIVLLRSCVFTTCYIPSAGMENSLLPGERIVVNKWSYGMRLPLMSLLGYHRWGERPVGREEIVVFNNPANRQEKVISRREVFTGRCVGLPGDTLQVDSLFSVLSDVSHAPDRTSLYTYPHQREAQMDSLLRTLSIPDRKVLGKDSVHHLRSFSRYEYYLLEQAIGTPCWLQAADASSCHADTAFYQVERGRNVYPLVIPRRGQSIEVHPWNRTLLCNTLVLHEKRRAEVRGDTLYVDGQPATHCTFTQDYYWIAANNAINLADSRLFGFVPHSHLIGRAARIWFSKEPETELNKGWRWERIGKKIE